MKKSLLALAVLGAFAGAASAQSSITLSGLVDVGVKKVSSQTAGADSTAFANNNTGTSAVFFKGTEDLGSVKAGFLLELDINPVSSSLANTDPTKGGQAFSGTPFNGEQFVSLAGAFGEVKLGTPNAAALTASSTSQPFGTALGSAFSAGFGRLGTQSVSGVNQYVGNGTGRIIRNEKTVVYSTPSFAGLKGTLEYSFKNDNSATPASNNNGYTSVALSYNQGPANVIVVSAKVAAGDTNPAAGSANTTTTTAVNSALAIKQSVRFNLLGANYTFGAATVYAGLTTTKGDPETIENSASRNLAVKFAVSPQVDLMANYLKRDNKLAANPTVDANLLGLGVDYKLSKRTTVYARY
ncbi:MAG: hypothetical protein RJA44_1603, partial [Pseudomonadota bacterium]